MLVLEASPQRRQHGLLDHLHVNQQPPAPAPPCFQALPMALVTLLGSQQGSLMAHEPLLLCSQVPAPEVITNGVLVVSGEDALGWSGVGEGSSP